MFRNSHLDNARQLFSDQFEPDGSGFLYRKSRRGAPIRVSAVERADFLTAFNRRLRYASWSMVAASLVLLLLVAWLVPDSEGMTFKYAIWFGLAAIIVPFLAIYYWAWSAPARDLERRPQVGVAKSKEEMRHLFLSEMTYGQLGFLAIAGIIFAWSPFGKEDNSDNFGIFRLICGGVGVTIAVVQAFRKWRYDRRG